MDHWGSRHIDKQTNVSPNRQNKSQIEFMEDRTQKLKPVFIECAKGDQLKTVVRKQQAYILFWMHYTSRACL